MHPRATPSSTGEVYRMHECIAWHSCIRWFLSPHGTHDYVSGFLYGTSQGRTYCATCIWMQSVPTRQAHPGCGVGGSRESPGTRRRCEVVTRTRRDISSARRGRRPGACPWGRSRRSRETTRGRTSHDKEGAQCYRANAVAEGCRARR